MKNLIIKWKCDICNDIVISDSNERHKINWCKCKKTAMDLEKYYRREIGNPIILPFKREKSKVKGKKLTQKETKEAFAEMKKIADEIIKKEMPLLKKLAKH